MKEVFDAIGKYATAYRAVEHSQPKVWSKRHPKDGEAPLQDGDQKTGVIGEFYGLLYARKTHPGRDVRYAGSGKAWDVEVWQNRRLVLRVQVKTVSAYAGYDRISRIRPGWDDLYLLRLDERLRPEGFWTLTASSVDWADRVLKDRTMPERGNPRSGSRELRDRTDKLRELQVILDRASGCTSHTAG